MKKNTKVLTVILKLAILILSAALIGIGIGYLLCGDAACISFALIMILWVVTGTASYILYNLYLKDSPATWTETFLVGFGPIGLLLLLMGFGFEWWMNFCSSIVTHPRDSTFSPEE